MNAQGDQSRRARHDLLVGLGLAAMILSGWLANHVAAIFFIDWAPDHWPFAVAIVTVQTWLSVGLFIVAHDAMHGSLAPGRPRLNRAVGQAFVGLYAGFSYDRLHASHHAHHRRPGTGDDPDFDAGNGRSFWLWYFRFFRHYFGWREFGFLTAAILLYALVLGERTPVIFVFWALPAILSSLQLFYFGTFLPHRVGDEPFADGHRARSNDYSKVLSLLTCFHFGYHHEHHDQPGAPWWRLPQLRTTACERFKTGTQT